MGSKCTSYGIFMSVSMNDNPLSEVTRGAVMSKNMRCGLCSGQVVVKYCQAMEDGS